jgi:uncharacterized membrane protein YraQ (UPF0718 family)
MTFQGRKLLLFVFLLLVLVSLPKTGHILMRWLLVPNALAQMGGLIQSFATIFLGIFIEAVPFLLAGTLVSGILDVFVSGEQLRRFIPGQGMRAVVSGVLLGLFFPVCECGVVPVTRRLLQKGIPLSAGIAFLLSAPVMNPVVIASTWAAFGFGRILLGRVFLAAGIAGLVGLVFSLHPRPEEAMVNGGNPPHICAILDQSTPEQPFGGAQDRVWDSTSSLVDRLYRVLLAAGEEFFEMGRYLVAGALLAAAMQTVVPQAVILSIGQGPVSSVVVMLVLAFVLSVCSTVDAFLSLAFASSFTTASLLAFLVFGPMVDIKSTLMFLGVFKQRVVVYLILLPLQLVFLLAVFANLNLSF